MFLRQRVVAGKTATGTTIQAELIVATLAEGKVIPRNAVLSGEVIESVARTATQPARLAVRIDSAQWKNGSASLKLYLTPWYYPTTDEAGEDLQYGPTLPEKRTWNGQGQYPDTSRSYKPFPGSDSDKGASVPDTASSTVSNHRVMMKDVEAGSSTDGTLTLVSKRSNLKLDKLTAYVFASGDLSPVPAK